MPFLFPGCSNSSEMLLSIFLVMFSSHLSSLKKDVAPEGISSHIFQDSANERVVS